MKPIAMIDEVYLHFLGHYNNIGSLSNIFPKNLASFRRKAYLCSSKAALGNLKASFHCARWHNLCSTKVESLK